MWETGDTKMRDRTQRGELGCVGKRRDGWQRDVPASCCQHHPAGVSQVSFSEQSSVGRGLLLLLAGQAQVVIHYRIGKTFQHLLYQLLEPMCLKERNYRH